MLAWGQPEQGIGPGHGEYKCQNPLYNSNVLEYIEYILLNSILELLILDFEGHSSYRIVRKTTRTILQHDLEYNARKLP